MLLTMPKGLHRRAFIAAQREGVSLEDYILAAVAEEVGARLTLEAMDQEIERLATSTDASKPPDTIIWSRHTASTAHFT